MSEDVGGGYGTRNSLYPEFTLVAWAARRLGRPARWTATRSEAFLGDYDGRDLVTEAELALDGEGRFLAMRSINTGNLGSHAVTFVPIARGPTVMTGLYDIPAAETAMKGVLTATVPVTAYRGAGRPEATFVLERLIDKAARETGIDRVALRERNPVSEQPYRNALGVVYDSGDFLKSQDMALGLSDWEGFEARRREAARRSRLRGIGLANYVETSTGWPVERAEMTVAEDGVAEVAIGTQSSGQGPETALPQIVAHLLDIPLRASPPRHRRYRPGGEGFRQPFHAHHAGRRAPAAPDGGQYRRGGAGPRGRPAGCAGRGTGVRGRTVRRAGAQ